METPHTHRKITDEQLEKLLRQLPQFDRSQKCDSAFLKHLHAVSKGEEAGVTFRAFSINWISFRRFTSIAGGAFAVFVVVLSLWAYQSDVTRGDFLYGWKRFGERIELSSAFTPLKKVDRHVRFADRRLAEAEAIIADNRSVGFLPVARAHGTEMHLDPETAENLSLTLADMRAEMGYASEIVENSLTSTEDNEVALERIENASDQHVEKLFNLTKNVSKSVGLIVQAIADASDEDLANVVEAREEVKKARARKETTVKVSFTRKLELVPPQTPPAAPKAPPRERASKELSETLTLVQGFLNPVQQLELAADIKEAQTALQKGKYGRALGITQSLQKEIMQKHGDLKMKQRDQARKSKATLRKERLQKQKAAAEKQEDAETL